VVLKINGCLGCEGCKKHLGKCVKKDDLTQLLQEMTTYDAIIMGTPVYWYHVTSQFKMLVDRLYCFLEFGENPETGETTIKSEFPEGKKGQKNWRWSYIIDLIPQNHCWVCAE